MSELSLVSPRRFRDADGAAGRRPGIGGLLSARVALGLIVAVGLGLRIAAARGPLGLDEIWSLKVAGTLPSIGDAFWGWPHDNNHALNTAILAALGPGWPAWVYRLPALALGVATIPVMARALAPWGSTAALVGALLVAVGLPFVDFGSEARGYAGLVLASVIAFDQWRRAMTASDRRHGAPGAARWGLAAAAGLGAFCHLAMAMTVAVLAAATLLLAGARSRRLAPTLRATAGLLGPAALALGPAALALGVAIRRGGGFRIGDVDPFTPAKMAEGLGDMVALTLGLPPSRAAPLLVAMLLACLVAAARRGLASPPTVALCGAAFGALPAALWLAHVPNVGYARYFAICAVVLVVALGEVAGRLWALGGAARRGLAAALAIVVAAGLLSDVQAIGVGRSPGPETLAIMRSGGSMSYATNRRLMATLLLGNLSPDAPREAAAPAACGVPPPWFVAVGDFDSRFSATVPLGTDACTGLYRVHTPFGSNPLSGTQWTLYRLVPAPSRTVTVSPGKGT